MQDSAQGTARDTAQATTIEGRPKSAGSHGHVGFEDQADLEAGRLMDNQGGNKP